MATREATMMVFFEVWEKGAIHPLIITSSFGEAKRAMQDGDEIRHVEWVRVKEVI